MQLQGLKRKGPNARHFFIYKLNGQTYSGLKPDYIQTHNTVIGPNIDVENDVKWINLGMAMAPKSSFPELLKLYLVLTEIIIACLILFFLAPFKIKGIAILITIVLYRLRFNPLKNINEKIYLLKSDSNRVEWEINERVYGEHSNPNGEIVLYPKRGTGFYTLSALEYLKLYTLQFHAGDVQKSETLFQNLRKVLIANRTINRIDRLTDRDKVLRLYKEFSGTELPQVTKGKLESKLGTTYFSRMMVLRIAVVIALFSAYMVKWASKETISIKEPVDITNYTKVELPENFLMFQLFDKLVSTGNRGGDHLYCTVNITNTTSKAAIAVTGRLSVIDKTDKELHNFLVDINEPLTPKIPKMIQLGGLSGDEYSESIAKNKLYKNIDLDKMRVKWIPEQVVFDDKTVWKK